MARNEILLNGTSMSGENTFSPRTSLRDFQRVVLPWHFRPANLPGSTAKQANTTLCMVPKYVDRSTETTPFVDALTTVFAHRWLPYFLTTTFAKTMTAITMIRARVEEMCAGNRPLSARATHCATSFAQILCEPSKKTITFTKKLDADSRLQRTTLMNRYEATLFWLCRQAFTLTRRSRHYAAAEYSRGSASGIFPKIFGCWRRVLVV